MIIQPRRWKDAQINFRFVKYSIYVYKLTGILRKLKVDNISDACTIKTENYNGQFTNQKGIHGFWES